jgi:hypothetical protein
MMYAEEFGVITSPHPTPISAVRDLLMPSLAGFGAFVLSISCANAQLVINPAHKTI